MRERRYHVLHELSFHNYGCGTARSLAVEFLVDKVEFVSLTSLNTTMVVSKVAKNRVSIRCTLYNTNYSIVIASN